MTSRRECQSCYFYEDADLARSGWCQHPQRHISPGLKLLVRGREIACRDELGRDLWESFFDQPGPIVAGAKPGTVGTELQASNVSTLPTVPRRDALMIPKVGVSTCRLLRVFLCYGSADKPEVSALYRRLVQNGVKPWFDEEDLLAGQDWEAEIPRAVGRSDVVVVCLSKTSVGKTGYVQKEIRFALDAADHRPESAIFIIPLRLEECDVPDRLRRYHWADLFAAKGFDQLLRSLSTQADRLGLRATSAEN